MNLDKISDIKNPGYGADIAYLWSEIKDNLRNPHWDWVAPTAHHYQDLSDAMDVIWGGRPADEVPELETSYYEVDPVAKLEHLLDDDARQIAIEVEERLGLNPKADAFDPDKICDSVNLGFRAAHELSKTLSNAEAMI